MMIRKKEWSQEGMELKRNNKKNNSIPIKEWSYYLELLS